MNKHTDLPLFVEHAENVQNILLPIGAMSRHVIQPKLLREDAKLGAVGVLTQRHFRDAVLGDESPWMLGTMLRGLVEHSRTKHLVDPEVEKFVVPAWAVGLLAALDIPTIHGKPIVARTDELDVWELHWVGSGCAGDTSPKKESS